MKTEDLEKLSLLVDELQFASSFLMIRNTLLGI